MTAEPTAIEKPLEENLPLQDESEYAIITQKLDRLMHSIYERTRLRPGHAELLASVAEQLGTWFRDSGIPDTQKISVKPFGSSQNCFGSASSDLDACIVFEDEKVQAAYHKKTTAVRFLTQLAHHLDDFHSARARKEADDFVSDMEVVGRQARIPVLKLVYHCRGNKHLEGTINGSYHENNMDEDGNFCIPVDLTVSNTMPLYNTELLRLYSQIDDRVPILGLVVKHWAKICGMNDASKGSLAPYTWIIMAIHFLQQVGIVPCLQSIGRPLNEYGENEERINNGSSSEGSDARSAYEGVEAHQDTDTNPENGFVSDGGYTDSDTESGSSTADSRISTDHKRVNDVYFLKDLAALPNHWPQMNEPLKGNEMSVGELFQSFLKFYSNYNFEERVITIRQIEPMSKRDKAWLKFDGMAIEDPFELERNLARNLEPEMVKFIRETFETSAKHFTCPERREEGSSDLSERDASSHSSADDMDEEDQLHDYFFGAWNRMAKRRPPKPMDGCFICGKLAHRKKNCPQAGPCYHCGELGHLRHECPQWHASIKCFNCAQIGHSKATCPYRRRPRCYNCNQRGHIQRNCPFAGAPMETEGPDS